MKKQIIGLLFAFLCATCVTAHANYIHCPVGTLCYIPADQPPFIDYTAAIDVTEETGNAYTCTVTATHPEGSTFTIIGTSGFEFPATFTLYRAKPTVSFNVVGTFNTHYQPRRGDIDFIFGYGNKGATIICNPTR